MPQSRYWAGIDRGRWARVRRAVLRRDGWLCQCGEAGPHYGNEVDHILPLHEGGAAYDLDNLRVLNRRCHIEITRAQNSRPDTGRSEWRDYVAALEKDTLGKC